MKARFKADMARQILALPAVIKKYALLQVIWKPFVWIWLPIAYFGLFGSSLSIAFMPMYLAQSLGFPYYSRGYWLWGSLAMGGAVLVPTILWWSVRVFRQEGVFDFDFVVGASGSSVGSAISLLALVHGPPA